MLIISSLQEAQPHHNTQQQWPQQNMYAQTLASPLKQKRMREGPAATHSVFRLNFMVMLYLHSTKLTLLRQQVQTWPGRKCCSKHELLSLPDQVPAHVASVVNPEYASVRRMIDLSTTCKHRAAKIHLSWEFRSELEWWHHMAASWNDTYMLASDHQEKTP